MSREPAYLPLMQRDTNLATVTNLHEARPEASPDKREALLRAALELFAERTYSAAPVPDIAARAGVGTGTVYRHFQSKEDLANSVFQRCKSAMHEMLSASFAADGSAQRRFLEMWHGLAAMAAADPMAIRFLELQHHEEYLNEDSRALREAVYSAAERFVRDGQAAGEIASLEPKIAIALVFGAFVGLFKAATQGRITLDDAAVASTGTCAWRLIAG